MSDRQKDHADDVELEDQSSDHGKTVFCTKCQESVSWPETLSAGRSGRICKLCYNSCRSLAEYFRKRGQKAYWEKLPPEKRRRLIVENKTTGGVKGKARQIRLTEQARSCVHAWMIHSDLLSPLPERCKYPTNCQCLVKSITPTSLSEQLRNEDAWRCNLNFVIWHLNFAFVNNTGLRMNARSDGRCLMKTLTPTGLNVCLTLQFPKDSWICVQKVYDMIWGWLHHLVYTVCEHVFDGEEIVQFCQSNGFLWTQEQMNVISKQWQSCDELAFKGGEQSLMTGVCRKVKFFIAMSQIYLDWKEESKITIGLWNQLSFASLVLELPCFFSLSVV